MESRFELNMDYDDEIGIVDNVSGDVIVLQTYHSANSIAFCSGLCNLLNVLNEENFLLIEENKKLKEMIKNE